MADLRPFYQVADKMNGLIIQWEGLVGLNEKTHTLPIAFKDENSYIVVSSLNANYNNGTTQRDQFRPNTNSTIYKNANYPASYIAIGLAP